MGKNNWRKGEKMQTPYSIENQKFSNSAHFRAIVDIYPVVFKTLPSNLEYVSTLERCEKNTILDGEMAIDYIVKAKSPFTTYPIEFTFQERFRDCKFSMYKDITITEYNFSSNLKSELYKLKANVFLYGYFNIQSSFFEEWVAIDSFKLLYNITIGNLKFDRKNNPRSNQTFITISFFQLEKHGCIISRKNANAKYNE